MDPTQKASPIRASSDAKKMNCRKNIAIYQIKPTVVIWIKTHISG